MKSYDVKKLSYRDELARKNRLFFIFRVVVFFAVLVVLLGGGVYFLFFTDKLEIKNITINGLETLDRDLIMAEVNKQSKNILLFDSDNVEANLLAINPVLKSVQAGKHLPHQLVVDVIERRPSGIWCSGSECRYFDKEMNTWGLAARSSGFLFLTIEDMRSKEQFSIEEDFFRSINEVAGDLPGLTVKTVTIPENSFDEFRVYTDKGFYITFSLDSDLAGQMEIFKIFWQEKSKDPAFTVQYIDLRIDGRVYFR